MQGKRGKALESLIDYTNERYKKMGWALVDKVPTPWNVRYNPRRKISEAFPEKKGTVDYIGISHGRSIAFDAKSTNIRTSFPLKNVQEHQVQYLIDHQNQGGKSFFIVEFEKLNETYLITIDQFLEWWDKAKEGGRKSIPHEFFFIECTEVKSKNGIPLDYLGEI